MKIPNDALIAFRCGQRDAKGMCNRPMGFVRNEPDGLVLTVRERKAPKNVISRWLMPVNDFDLRYSGLEMTCGRHAGTALGSDWDRPGSKRTVSVVASPEPLRGADAERPPAGLDVGEMMLRPLPPTGSTGHAS